MLSESVSHLQWSVIPHSEKKQRILCVRGELRTTERRRVVTELRSVTPLLPHIERSIDRARPA